MLKWVRRYAQNRSLPVAVNLVVFVLLSAAIGLPSFWGGQAYRDGNMALLVICLGAVILAVGATIYLSLPPWRGMLRIKKAVEKLYASEGQATITSVGSRRPWLGATIAGAFLLCVTGSVVLGLLGYLPSDKYMQPISALYVVPFLVALYYLMRPAVGAIALLWPLLYAVHAVLIVAGAPIVFAEPWDSLNMLIPIAGYGILAALVGHAYSRWALHNARVIAAGEPNGSESPAQGSQD